MHQDGDVVSLDFSCACIISIVLIPIFWSAYRVSSCTTFLIMSFMSLISAGIFLFIVYVSRINFSSNGQRKQKGLEREQNIKALDRLEGLDYEERLEKLSPDDRIEYLKCGTKKRKLLRRLLGSLLKKGSQNIKIDPVPLSCNEAPIVQEWKEMLSQTVFQKFYDLEKFSTNVIIDTSSFSRWGFPISSVKNW